MAKVLIADPIADVRAVLASTIGLLGWECLLAEDEDTALRAACHEPPDVILVEVTLPSRGGWNFLRTLRSQERTRQVPALLISGWPHLQPSLDLYDLHPWSFLSKPFRPAVLLHAIGQLLRFGQRHSCLELDDAVVVGSLTGSWINLMGKKIRRRPRRDPRPLRLPDINDRWCPSP